MYMACIYLWVTWKLECYEWNTSASYHKFHLYFIVHSPSFHNLTTDPNSPNLAEDCQFLIQGQKHHACHEGLSCRKQERSSLSRGLRVYGLIFWRVVTMDVSLDAIWLYSIFCMGINVSLPSHLGGTNQVEPLQHYIQFALFHWIHPLHCWSERVWTQTTR